MKRFPHFGSVGRPRRRGRLEGGSAQHARKMRGKSRAWEGVGGSDPESRVSASHWGISARKTSLRPEPSMSEVNNTYLPSEENLANVDRAYTADVLYA